MNNTFIGFLKNLINLAIVIACITGGVILYKYLFPYMVKHMILYSGIYIFIFSCLINWADSITRTIFSRTYIDTAEIKKITEIVVDTIQKSQESKEEENNNPSNVVYIAD